MTGIDSAWAAAEAELPGDDWLIAGLTLLMPGYEDPVYVPTWQAEANRLSPEGRWLGSGDPIEFTGSGDTPTEALNDLAERLRRHKAT